MAYLVNHVKELRARYNWTQAELGAKVGVTRQTIASIEKGNYIPSLLLGLQICEVFHLKAEDVFQIKKGGDHR
ncbi:MAG: helix-turn-helix transcriptional regulator [Sporolactobacillus sp.]|jgi:DNA-binding XRE family transcriptional regulator|nr:helix-turn-helix transcriptional regulator [Sporolactobacillus sp.]